MTRPPLIPSPALRPDLRQLIRQQVRMVKRSPVLFTAERAAQSYISRHCNSEAERELALAELGREVLR